MSDTITCFGCGFTGPRREVGLHYRNADLNNTLLCLYSAYIHKNSHGKKPPTDYVPSFFMKIATLPDHFVQPIHSTYKPKPVPIRKDKKKDKDKKEKKELLCPGLEYPPQIKEVMAYYVSKPADPYLFDNIVSKL